MTIKTTPGINTNMTMREWSMLLLLSLVWGGSFFFNGVAVKELPTFTIIVCRVVLAAMVLIAIVYATGDRLPKSGQVWQAFFVMGLLNNVVPFSLIVWGQTHIASGLASILNATTPLFTVLVAHVLTGDEKLTLPRCAGVLLGFAGVAVMLGFDQFDLSSMNIWAQVAVLGGAVSYAFAGVYGRRFKGMGMSPIVTATGQVTASSVMLFPVMLLVDHPWTLAMPTLSGIGALLGIGILSTALAYILYFRILSTAGATNLLLVTFLIPVSAIVLGYLILNEVLAPQHFMGMGLIGLGLIAIDGRLWKRLKKNADESCQSSQ